MADGLGLGGTISGAAELTVLNPDVYVIRGTVLPAKPASAAAAATLFDGVAAVNTCTYLIPGATAMDGDHFKLPSQAGVFIPFMDLDAAGAAKPTVSGANFYISVPFADADAIETMAASLVSAVNNHHYASQEILATAVGAVVTLTAIKGGQCDAAIDIDMSTLATIANTTPGTGDWDKLDKTAEGQLMNTEDVTTFNDGQGGEHITEEQVLVDVKAANFNSHNHRVIKAKYNGQSIIIAYWAPNSTRKQLEWITLTGSVKKITEEKMPMTHITGKQKAGNVDDFYAIHDMMDDAC